MTATLRGGCAGCEYYFLNSYIYQKKVPVQYTTNYLFGLIDSMHYFLKEWYTAATCG